MKDRESFKSRLGFLLVSAGCAIGLGNIWKFPYVTGEYGGGAFVLFYLIFLVLLGIPVLAMELSIGRASGQTIVGAYRKLERPGTHWHIHGFFCMAGCYLLMMFYVPVAGWLMDYFVRYIAGSFEGVRTAAQAETVFDTMEASPGEMVISAYAAVIIGFLVCVIGLQKGVEKVTKIMMIGLFSLILVLVIHSLTLEGAGEALRFYLIPDFKRMAGQGIGNVINAAMNQAFFTLSIGNGAMAIFGSYMSREKSILGEAARITLLDTIVAVCAGLLIFPGCFTFNVASTAGESLIFEALPTIFGNMAGGRVWGALFFLFMSFAALSTIIAVFENLVANLMDSRGWSRKKSTAVNFVIMLLAVLPCILGLNRWSGIRIFGFNFMKLEDFIVSNLLLPVGGLVYTVFCVYSVGWGFDRFKEEVDRGTGVKLPLWSRYFFVFVLPPVITIVLLGGLPNAAMKWIFGTVLGLLILFLYVREVRYLVSGKKGQEPLKQKK